VISHEATIGRIGEEELFYLESRGISRNDAVRMIISGFVEPIVKALPLEYAVEFNKLIDLEMSNGN
jgi:Fe-S cluster assembly protein SufB